MPAPAESRGSDQITPKPDPFATMRGPPAPGTSEIACGAIGVHAPASIVASTASASAGDASSAIASIEEPSIEEPSMDPEDASFEVPASDEAGGSDSHPNIEISASISSDRVFISMKRRTRSIRRRGWGSGSAGDRSRHHG